MQEGVHAIIDFDSNDWMASLSDAVLNSVPQERRAALPTAQVSYTDDALDFLVDRTSASRIVDDTLAWIRSNSVRVYHGTRLTDEEAEAMKRDGMRPLSVDGRIDWLRTTFPQLAPILTQDFVSKAMDAGQMRYRESQVHAAISRREMFAGYDYLKEGSEFDRRLLEWGGRPDLVATLKSRGRPRLVSLVVPGDEALAAMHPYFSVDDVRATDTYPNLVRELLRAWAWELHRPGGQREGVDACLMFRAAVPGEFVEDVVAVTSAA